MGAAAPLALNRGGGEPTVGKCTGRKGYCSQHYSLKTKYVIYKLREMVT